MTEHCATTPVTVASELEAAGVFAQVQGISHLLAGQEQERRTTRTVTLTWITEVSIFAAELRDMHFFLTPVTWRTSFAGII
jgi:hypothetical protein